jgi:hypothetical protein
MEEKMVLGLNTILELTDTGNQLFKSYQHKSQ